MSAASATLNIILRAKNKLLTFPWKNGLNIDDIEKYYEDLGFTDWTHKEAKAPMLKMQHPEFEMYNSGIHARSGVSCAIATWHTSAPAPSKFRTTGCAAR